jgi:hypothetical protein
MFDEPPRRIADQPNRYLDAFGQPVSFSVGLDLGLHRDFSAVVVNEKRVSDSGVVFHSIQFAHRFRLGTPYFQVARSIADLVAQLPERPESAAVWMDRTGIGDGVVEMLEAEGVSPWKVVLGAGQNWAVNPGKRISLPKAIAVSELNVVLQNGAIGIAADLPFLDQLVRELGTYRVTSTASGADAFSSQTEADHDDLVVALMLSVFGASKYWGPPRTVFL